jgi:small subunit ribosomal protein S21
LTGGDRSCNKYFFEFRIQEDSERLVAVIFINDGETIEGALRRFKRRVQQEDIIKDVKKHSYYLKPGEKKRLKSALARKRDRRRLRREAD